MKALEIATMPRWRGAAQRRARAAAETPAPEPLGFGRARPAPTELYSALGALFGTENLPELMRALDG